MRENPQREFRARCQYGGINLMVADREQLFQSTRTHTYTSSYTSKPLDLLIFNFLYTWYYTQEGMGMQVMLVDNVSLTETVWYPPQDCWAKQDGRSKNSDCSFAAVSWY